jgi:hypothetical protein
MGTYTRLEATQICGLITVVRNYQSKGTRLNEMVAESMPKTGRYSAHCKILLYEIFREQKDIICGKDKIRLKQTGRKL